jgi:hypothetical protein
MRSLRKNRRFDMKTALLALTGVAVALTAAAPTAAREPKNYVCTKWDNGICTSTHRVRGAPAPYAVGHVFGPTYSYTTYSTLPAPLVSYYHLDPAGRYVYSNGYVYVVDPSTYAVTRVIDMFSR